LEGYSNCGLHRNTYPDTIIPKGFFDNQIKISYGFNERIPGYVHINPLIKNYATVDPKGVDYRCVLEDLPLFWKDRISEVKIADNIDENLMLKARNDAMLTLYNETCSSIPRDLLIKKIDISLRKDKNGAIPLSKENEIVYKGDYCTFAHHNLKNQKPNISVICAELSYGTPNNALRSLNTQSLERSKYEIIWTGCISEFVYWRDWARTLPTDVAFTSNQVTNWRHGTYNIHQSLNEAAIAAKSDTLLFCTSTAIFPSRILNVIADYYSKPNNQDSILILPVTPINSEETSKESWRDFIACKKDMWSKLGGFDESSIYNGQAWDLSELVRRAQKLGITINNIDSNEIIFGLDSSLDEPRIPRPANDAIATTTTPSKINRSLLSNQIETIKLDNSLPDNVILLIDDLNDHLITGNISLAQSAMAQLNEFNDISNPILSFLEPLSLGDIASAFDSIIRSLQQSAVKPATLIVTAGILAFSLKLYEQAEQLFIQSINLDQANFHSRLLLTELLESAGKNEFALQLSYDSLRFYPKNQEFMLRVNRLATTSAT
jgi:tetratricopeptide (TPR) repeat protein